jgi:hypothetical protein
MFCTDTASTDTRQDTSKNSILSVLALEGLFDLVVNHGLECRDFYKHLHRLVTPSLFYLAKKYRTRCFVYCSTRACATIEGFLTNRKERLES